MFCRETQNTAHSVEKFRNTRFEAEIFRKKTRSEAEKTTMSACLHLHFTKIDRQQSNIGALKQIYVKSIIQIYCLNKTFKKS